MHDRHWIDELRLSRGARLGLGHAPVQIAINGRDFTTLTLTLTQP